MKWQRERERQKWRNDRSSWMCSGLLVRHSRRAEPQRVWWLDLSVMLWRSWLVTPRSALYVWWRFDVVELTWRESSTSVFARCVLWSWSVERLQSACQPTTTGSTDGLPRCWPSHGGSPRHRSGRTPSNFTWRDTSQCRSRRKRRWWLEHALGKLLHRWTHPSPHWPTSIHTAVGRRFLWLQRHTTTYLVKLPAASDD